MTTDTAIAANPAPGSAPTDLNANLNPVERLPVTAPVEPAAVAPPAAVTAPVTPPADPAKPTDPAAVAKPGDTVLDDPKPADPASVTDGWRERMANGDVKVLDRLKRFADESAFFNSYKAMETKLSSGELKKTLSANPTPEEIASFRKENNVPETPEQYDLNLGNGLVIGEADKPMVSEFTKAMHAINAPHNVVQQALATYYKIQESNQATEAETNRTAKQTTEDTLRTDWGSDYRHNINVLKSYTDTMPGELKEALFAAKLPNGAQFMNSPAAIKFFANLAVEQNPAATVVPNSSQPGPDIDAEIRSIEAKMGTKEYYANPALADRYMALTSVRDKLKARA